MPTTLESWMSVFASLVTIVTFISGSAIFWFDRKQKRHDSWATRFADFSRGKTVTSFDMSRHSLPTVNYTSMLIKRFYAQLWLTRERRKKAIQAAYIEGMETLGIAPASSTRTFMSAWSHAMSELDGRNGK